MSRGKDADCAIVAAIRQSCCIENTQYMSAMQMGGFRARSGSLLGASGLRRVDRELPQPFAQRVAVDAEPPCGFELVAAHFAQGAAEQRRFDDFLKPGVENAVTPHQFLVRERKSDV